MTTGLKPVWAGTHMRLDPFRMPQTANFPGREEDGDVAVVLDYRGATIRRVLNHSHLPVTLVIPARMFRGVAARAMEDESGTVTVTLELLHTDPALSVPLLVAGDLDDIAADWRAWAEAYGLPMMLIEADGVARSLEESAGAAIKVARAQRRQGKASRKRRPRFLMRRKQASLGVRLVVSGREIIARD